MTNTTTATVEPTAILRVPDVYRDCRYLGWGQEGPTTVDGQTITVHWLEDGSREIDTPAGTFEVEDDGTGEAWVVMGPNHHYPDVWTDTLADAMDTVAILGTDGRTARHLVKADQS